MRHDAQGNRKFAPNSLIDGSLCSDIEWTAPFTPLGRIIPPECDVLNTWEMP
jgi:hypothetical protein